MATESLSVEFELSWCRGGDIEALADASSSPAAAVLSLCECIECKLNYKVLTTSQPDYVYNLILVQSTCRTHSSSVVTLARPPYLRLQITNRSLDMRHLTCEISSLLYSVNSVYFPPGSPHSVHITSSQSPSLLSSSITPLTFHYTLQTSNSSLSQILSSVVFLVPSGLPSRILNL